MQKRTILLFILIFSGNSFSRANTAAQRAQRRAEAAFRGMLSAQEIALSTLQHGLSDLCLLRGETRSSVQSQCNESIDDMYRSTMGPSFYGEITGRYSFRECTAGLSIDEESYQQVLRYFESITDNHTNFTSESYLCTIGYSRYVGEHHFMRTAAVVEASHLYEHKRIEAMALQSLQGINNINTIMGMDVGLSDITCTNEVSETVQETCERLPSCDYRGGHIFNYAEMTLRTIESMDSLENANQRLMLERASIIGSSFGDEESIQRMYAIEALIQENESLIEDMKRATPWIEGTVFKRSMTSIKRALNDINSGDPSIAVALRNTLLRTIGNTLTEQLSEDRDHLVRRYDNALRANRCLKENFDCDDYEDIIETTPTPDLDIEVESADLQAGQQVAEELFQAHQCLEDRERSINMTGLIARDVASVAAGFALGGIGGVTRAAMIAGRIFQRGNTLRAIGAGAVLGAEAMAIGHLGGQALDSCQNSSQFLSNSDEHFEELGCLSRRKMHVMQDYSQCIVDSTMLALNVVGTILPDFLPGNRFGREAAQRSAREAYEELVDDLLEGRNLGNLDQAAIRNTLMELAVRENEIRRFSRLLNSLAENVDDQRAAETALRYFNTLSNRQQDLFIENLRLIAGKQPIPAGTDRRVLSLANNFRRQQRQFDTYERRVRDRFLSNASRNANGPIDETQRASMLENATERARIARARRERNTLGCQARKVTPQHERGAQLFTRVMVGFGMGSTAFGYTAANLDEPMDARFWGNLTYEMTIAYYMSHLAARLTSNPTLSNAQRYVVSNAQSSVLGVLDAAIFAQVYGISEQEADQLIERLRNSPEQLADLAELEQHLQANNIVEAMSDYAWDNFLSLRSAPETAELFNEEEIEIGGEIFRGPLTDEMLQDENIRRDLRAALTREIYDSMSNGLLDLGNIGADKWAYDRAYNLSVGVPKAMLASYLSYRVLCRGADRPVAALTGALGIQFVNQYLLGGYLYFAGREEVIGR